MSGSLQWDLQPPGDLATVADLSAGPAFIVGQESAGAEALGVDRPDRLSLGLGRQIKEETSELKPPLHLRRHPCEAITSRDHQNTALTD